MKALEQQRMELELLLKRYDDVIAPSFEAADKAVGKYGFGSYVEMCTAMMQMVKRIVALAKSIKESSGIAEDVGGMDLDDILECYEPMVNTMIPGVQNSLIDTFPAETFDEADSDEQLGHLVKFMTV